MKRIKNIKEKNLSDTWFTFKKVIYDYQTKEGNWETHEREVLDRGNGVAILLYDKLEKKILLVRQFRIPCYLNKPQEGFLLEVCAGALEEEDPRNCVIRETEEETGLRISKVEKVMEAYMSPGAVTEKLHLYIAEYDESMRASCGGGLSLEQEEIELFEVEFQKALEMISVGEICDAKTILLIQFLALRSDLAMLSTRNTSINSE
jgi:nudix-type nucleoside diphosphatase (YffH/AdpP family)